MRYPAAARAAAQCSLSRTASWYNLPFSWNSLSTVFIAAVPALLSHVRVENSKLPLDAVVQLTEPWIKRLPIISNFECWMPGKEPDLPTAA